MNLTSRQIIAARALLGWNQSNLAELSNISVPTIKSAEADTQTVKRATLDAIRSAIETHGVEFLPGNGVRERTAAITQYDGPSGLIDVYDDIFHTVADPRADKEILILNNAEPVNYNPQVEEYLAAHIERLEKIGAKEKIIGCEGDDDFFSGPIEYRVIPKEDFEDSPTIIYGDKIALWRYGPPAKAIIIHDRSIAQSFRKFFGWGWKHARTPEARS